MGHEDANVHQRREMYYRQGVPQRDQAGTVDMGGDSPAFENTPQSGAGHREMPSQEDLVALWFRTLEAEEKAPQTTMSADDGPRNTAQSGGFHDSRQQPVHDLYKRQASDKMSQLEAHFQGLQRERCVRLHDDPLSRNVVEQLTCLLPLSGFNDPRAKLFEAGCRIIKQHLALYPDTHVNCENVVIHKALVATDEPRQHQLLGFEMYRSDATDFGAGSKRKRRFGDNRSMPQHLMRRRPLQPYLLLGSGIQPVTHPMHCLVSKEKTWNPQTCVDKGEPRELTGNERDLASATAFWTSDADASTWPTSKASTTDGMGYRRERCRPVCTFRPC